MNYLYAAEKFSQARRCLMLPHTQGEHTSIMMALHECSLGLRNLNNDDIDDNAHYWIETLKGIMDVNGVDDPTGEGKWSVKARGMTSDEKSELSTVVDNLANWFDHESS
ncbi:MAG TPA: hypothetical protein P5295_17595 [Spirochaetota bacterium]|nr:hypothetical protein [Spirochaetota bacterium]